MEQIAGDVSVRHPVQGISRSAGGTVGRWIPTALQDRYTAKTRKHGSAYKAGAGFIPLVVSTFGILHPDFLRLLWVLAGVYLVRARVVGSRSPLLALCDSNV
jgi:hypothetical protein